MRLGEKQWKKKRLIGNDPIRVSPSALCPSPSVAVVLVGIEEGLEPVEEVTVEL